MNEQLQNALKELAGQGAIGVPESKDVEDAENGTKFTGALPNGTTWTLEKHNQGSYTVHY